MTESLAVLGCGLMGSALARRFAGAGRSVVVWNRSPERAQALTSAGAFAAKSVDDAVRAAGLVVVCMSDIEAAQATLQSVSDLNGRTVVNLSDGTREDVENLARWLGDHGAYLLDGSTFCYPDQIGDPDAMLVFAGRSEIWIEHERTLMLLGGRTRYLSPDVAAAKELYMGTGSAFTGALVGFVEASAFLLRRGRSPEEVTDGLLYVVELLRYAAQPLAAVIESGRHETDQATVDIFAEGIRRTIEDIQRTGIDTTMTAAALRKLDAAKNAGMGSLGTSALAML